MTTLQLAQNQGRKTCKELIEHLEKLERSLIDEPIPKKQDSKDATESSSTTSILKKDKIDKNPRVAFGKGARDKTQKACELCKVMKGAGNPAWKTHNNKDCRLKEY